jgi:hypothetical protein
MGGAMTALSEQQTRSVAIESGDYRDVLGPQLSELVERYAAKQGIEVKTAIRECVREHLESGI